MNKHTLIRTSLLLTIAASACFSSRPVSAVTAGSGLTAPESTMSRVPSDSAGNTAASGAGPAEDTTASGAGPAEETGASQTGSATAADPSETASSVETELVSVSGSDVVPDGVYFEDLSLGGLTLDEAKAEIEKLYQQAAESRVTVTWNDQSISCRFSKLGYTWDYEDSLEFAVANSESGSLISRYKAQQDLKYENFRIDPVVSYKKSRVQKLVKTRIASGDTDPVNAMIDRENGEFIRTDSVDGQKTDVSATVQSICDAMDQGPTNDITVEASVETTKPEITSAYLDQIQDRLGTFHTDYSSSSSARKTNIAVAAKRLDGTILAPGEQLSVSEAIGSRTAENGYELAPQYVDGTSQDSYGGGVCQVSTTLYNAVIRAELQIDERHPHSMVVHYVPYSSDAAIAEGNKDFKFTNNTDYPVYIAADADGSTLYFSVYGKETRPEDREVKFVSDTISETTPEDEVKEDPDLAAGETRTEGSRHPQVVSTLTKEVYVGGELQSSKVINSDTYAGTHRTIYKGTKKENAAETKDAGETKKEANETKASEETKETASETEKQKDPKKETKEKKETSAPEDSDDSGEDQTASD